MATYVYECGEHGLFEVMKPMTDSHFNEPCPQCKFVSPRKYTPPTNVMNPSGDGYFMDTKNGLDSRGRAKKTRWA